MYNGVSRTTEVGRSQGSISMGYISFQVVEPQ